MNACIFCGEIRKAALKIEDGNVVCYNCSKVYGKKYKRGTCFLCLRQNVKIELHHIYGIKIHRVAFPICSSCHKTITLKEDELSDIMLKLLAAHIMRVGEYGENIDFIDWKASNNVYNRRAQYRKTKAQTSLSR